MLNSIKLLNCRSYLGVVIDRQLNFDEYLISLCKISGKKVKVKALARLANSLNLTQPPPNPGRREKRHHKEV